MLALDGADARRRGLDARRRACALSPGRYENPQLALRPSEYFHRQCWVSVECEETPAPAAVEQCGADRSVFSTDYPYYDTKYPEATAHVLKLPLRAGGFSSLE